MALARVQADQRAVEAAAEIELDPSETAPDGAGNVQSAGVQPTLTFARANGHDPVRPATFQRTSPAPKSRYCPHCYVQLPLAVRGTCPNCGRPVGRV